MVRFSIVKYRNRFAEFTAWGIPGKIWWDKETKNWYVEVWKKKNYLDTVAGEIIEDLLFPSTKCLPAGDSSIRMVMHRSYFGYFFFPDFLGASFLLNFLRLPERGSYQSPE